MIDFARYSADGSIVAGPIEGQIWSRITEQSRFWPYIAEWEAAGNTIPPYMPPLPTIDDYRSAIQVLIDKVAQSRKYDSGNSLASYAASTNQAWSAEAQAFIAWRDQVWAYAYAELEKVQNGERGQPTVEEFLSELPNIEWPLD